MRAIDVGSLFAVWLIASVVLVFVVLLLGGAALMRGNRQAPVERGPEGELRGTIATQTRDRIFFFRFEGTADEDFVAEMLARHAGGASPVAIRDPAKIREVALDLVRVAPTATHAFAGPAQDVPGGIALARCGLEGGVIVGFRITSTRKLGSVADDTDMAAIVAELRAVAGFTAEDVVTAELARANGALEANMPPLLAVEAATRPGQQQCTYCRHSFAAYETKCPSCGAPVAA